MTNDSSEYQSLASDIIGSAPSTEDGLGSDAPPITVLGVRELEADGFTPIEAITGILWIVEEWPEEHRRFVPDTRHPTIGDQAYEKLWCVRSPWPSMTAGDAVSVAWENVPRTALPPDEDQIRVAIRQALAWDEKRALEALERL